MNREAEFDLVASLLEELTPLSRIEARGTLRIALKSAGFEAKDIARETMQAVVERVLPKELAALGIEDTESLSLEMIRRLSENQSGIDGVADSPEDVFERIGQR